MASGSRPRRLSARASSRWMGAFFGASSAAFASFSAAASVSCCRISSRPRFAHPAGSAGTSSVTRASFSRASTSWLVCKAARPTWNADVASR